MKKFLLIYGANAEALEAWKNATEQEQEQDMQDWLKWMQEHSKYFVDGGNPVGKNTRVDSMGQAKECSNEMAGYSIISVKDKQEALEILKENPHTKTPGSYIELMEIVDMEM